MMCVFCFCPGVATDCDPHAGDSSRPAGPDDPRSDGDRSGGAAEAHAAAGRDNGGPAAEPWRPQPGTGASRHRQPEPAAQAADASARGPAEDAHQASVPLARSAAALAGSRAPRQPAQSGRQCHCESSSGKLSLKQSSGSSPSQDAVTSRTHGSGRFSWVAWPVRVPQRAALALGRAACVQVPGAVRNGLLKLRCFL